MTGMLKAVLLLGALALPVSAQAQFDSGGGGNSGSSDGDWAVRDELKNPRLIEPYSAYGYDRSYSRGPAPWPYPPAYQAERPPRRPVTR
jgi:hypothetical protein